ncbi:FtsX-like permease family protein [Streptomyces harbinensis]|uniref:FtsX-like permease family protein n=1 Tax=Streptomyces harbinensis TaxID=1176198 RepID=UPI0033949469
MNGATGDGARSGARSGARGRAGAAAVLARAALRHQRRSWRTVFVAVLATSLLLGCFALAVTTVALGRPAVERYAAAPVVVTADQTTHHRGAQAPLTERLRIPASVADLLRSVPEVARAVTDREFRVPADDGTTYPGRPWEAAELAPWELREGRAPEAAGEVVASADLDLPVGARVAGYRVVGVADGPAALWFTAPEAARLGGQDTVDVIGVLPGPGVSTGALSTAVREALDAAGAVDARPADERPADDTGELRVLTGDGRGAAEALGAAPLWRDLLALFGAISGTVLMVAGLVLATLITRALRHRAGELALLRAVGAQPGQLRATVCREATAVALPAALLGAALAVPVFALLWRPVTAQAATAGLALPVVPWALPAPLLTAALTVAAVALAALPATAASGRPATPRGSGRNHPPGGPAPDGGRAVPPPTATRHPLPQRRQPTAMEPPARSGATGASTCGAAEAAAVAPAPRAAAGRRPARLAEPRATGGTTALEADAPVASASSAAAVPDGAAVAPPPEAGAGRRPARLTEASAEPRVSGRITLSPDDGSGHGRGAASPGSAVPADAGRADTHGPGAGRRPARLTEALAEPRVIARVTLSPDDGPVYDRGAASPGSAVPADAGRADTHGPGAGRTPARLGGSRSTPGRAGAAADGPERGPGSGRQSGRSAVQPDAHPVPDGTVAGGPPGGNTPHRREGLTPEEDIAVDDVATATPNGALDPSHRPGGAPAGSAEAGSPEAAAGSGETPPVSGRSGPSGPPSPARAGAGRTGRTGRRQPEPGRSGAGRPGVGAAAASAAPVAGSAGPSQSGSSSARTVPVGGAAGWPGPGAAAASAVSAVGSAGRPGPGPAAAPAAPVAGSAGPSQSGSLSARTAPVGGPAGQPRAGTASAPAASEVGRAGEPQPGSPTAPTAPTAPAATAAPTAPTAPATPAAGSAAAGSAGRRIGGLVVLGLGGASAGSAVALPGDGAAAAAGAAVVVMVIGCALLGPWIAGWVLGLLARPLRRLGGAGGWLAVAHGRADSARLGAAIVPIVLVTAFAVVQLGAEASVRHATAEQARAAGSAEGALATTVLTTRSELGDPVIDRHPALGVTAEELRALDPGVRVGDLGALGPGTVAVGADRARALGAGVGDTLTLRYGDGTEARLRVVAVYERSLALGAFLLDRGQLAPHVTDPDAPPAPAPAQDLERRLSTAAVAAIAALALLAVCSTLTVITVGRRPERDLLRRVGAGRGQLGTMLAVEAAVVAVTGLLLGAAVAALPLTAFSWATLHAPPYLPPGQAAALVAAVVLTTAAGSLLPALRR